MPLAVLSAMREAGREHITVKGGSLGKIAQADTMVFDKTGTPDPRLSLGVARVIPFGGHRETEMLRLGGLPGGTLPPLYGQRRCGGSKAP